MTIDPTSRSQHWIDGSPLADAPVDVAATFDGAMWRSTKIDPAFNLIGVKLRAGFTMPRHHQSLRQLVIVFGGELRVEHGGEDRTVGPGQFFVISAGDALHDDCRRRRCDVHRDLAGTGDEARDVLARPRVGHAMSGEERRPVRRDRRRLGRRAVRRLRRGPARSAHARDREVGVRRRHDRLLRRRHLAARQPGRGARRPRRGLGRRPPVSRRDHRRRRPGRAARGLPRSRSADDRGAGGRSGDRRVRVARRSRLLRRRARRAPQGPHDLPARTSTAPNSATSNHSCGDRCGPSGGASRRRRRWSAARP